MIDYKQISMTDVAFELMTKKKSSQDFDRLWKEVREIKGFTNEESVELKSLFYTNITLDGRFITLGENVWDLRSRHKFEDVHIDMNEIYADVEEVDEDDDSEDSFFEDDEKDADSDEEEED